MNSSNVIQSNSKSLAQYIIIDIGIPTPSHITENILKTIQNVVCLAPSRVQAVGVALVNATLQPVVGLAPTDTQLRRIIQAIKSVIDSGNCRARIPLEEFMDNLHIGIKKAVEDFDNLLEKLEETRETSAVMLQITIFSMKNGFEIKACVEQFLPSISTSHLKKIQVVEVTEEYMQLEPYRSFARMPSYVEYLRKTLIQLGWHNVQIAGSRSRLDELLKQWLVIDESDQEHVRIILQDSAILCDIRECLIAPGTVFQAASQNDKWTPAAELLQLEVTHRLPSDGLSETEVFGDPLALVPSQCGQLDGIYKQHNHQYFSALSEKLLVANEYLVAKHEVKKHLVKYFVLMPGEGMLLLKNLITAEIAIPSTTEAQNMLVTEEVECHVDTLLNALPSVDSHNPAEFSTGLYQQLVQSALSGNSQGSRPHTSQCKDPTHQSVVVGIEIKKSTKLKKASNGKLRKSTYYDLPKLTSLEEQTLDAFLERKRKKNSAKNK